MSEQISITCKGQGEPMILIHGFLSDSAVWSRFGSMLEQQYMVYYVDLPGHGNSPAQQNWSSISELAVILLECFAKEGISRAYLVGHSLGGYVVLELCRQGFAAQGLVFLNSYPYVDTDKKKEQRKREIVLLQKNQKERVYSLLLQSALQRIPQQEHTSLLRAANLVSVDDSIQYLQAILERRTNLSFLNSYTFPIIVIQGAVDTITLSSEAPHTSIVHVLEHCGHYSFLEYPEICVTLIQEGLTEK